MPAEFAPGIPTARTIAHLPQITKPVVWTLVLQRHEAERAGVHFDLRLSDGHQAHSWALRYWPTTGENRLATQQPTHTHAYLNFEGKIESGYGAGTVTKAREERAEILHADDEHVRFNLYPGQRTEEYLLRRTAGKQWLLRNLTRTRASAPHLPDYKPEFRRTTPEKLDPTHANEIWQAKIDGAHVLVDCTGSRPRVYSYRRGTQQDLIQHTFKMPEVFERDTPPALAGSILRGDVTALKGGTAVAAARVGGLLNSNTWQSRTQQKDAGRLVIFVHDVVRWQGKDVAGLDYGAKLPMLEIAWAAASWIKKPPTAFTAGAKTGLRDRIGAGREKSTREGLVVWRRDDPKPTKAPFAPERDVYVRKVFMEQGARGLAGGFEYALTPGGPIVGRVGTGFSHGLKAHMAQNPSLYVGLKASIRAKPAPDAYAPRAPVFSGWHLDQQLPEGIKMAYRQ